MEKLISVLASPIPFILLISLVITVHELGHYWAGRLFGAAVESFSVGFGRSIVEIRDRRGTRWRLNWLPIGGFVKFVGELQGPQDTREGAGNTEIIGKAFSQLGPLKRLVISLGGPIANFVFAIIVFAGLGFSFGLVEAEEVRVSRVASGSAAELAGFLPGDVIRVAGGREVHTSTDVMRATMLSAGEAVDYEISRNGEPFLLVATPRETETRNDAFKVVEKIGRIGLEMEQVNLHVRKLNPIEAVGYGATATADALGSTLTVLRRLITGRDGLDKMNGPVGIFGLSDNVTDAQMNQEGVGFGERLLQTGLRLIELAALFSIGVGFFNLLPIPVLDGGAAVMCIAEATTGREIPERVQRVGLTIGLACLVSFALVITWNDVTRPGGPLEVLSGMLS
ncbi:MAG: M50 family metallopeptidase [Alphaproteobacteria bacterium]|nr:M50 family metallopeptidase [Alphaproteobacteria bacterium]